MHELLQQRGTRRTEFRAQCVQKHTERQCGPYLFCPGRAHLAHLQFWILDPDVHELHQRCGARPDAAKPDPRLPPAVVRHAHALGNEHGHGPAAELEALEERVPMSEDGGRADGDI